METDVEAAAMDSDQMSDAAWIREFWQQNKQFYGNDLSQLLARLDPELANAVAVALESEAATMVTVRFSDDWMISDGWQPWMAPLPRGRTEGRQSASRPYRWYARRACQHGERHCALCHGHL